MDVFVGDISALVFKRSIKGDIGEFSLDSNMLKVLMELDGKKNLATVAQAINMDMEALREVAARLYNIKLVAKVEKKAPVLNKAFFDVLTAQLSLALGPIAEFLIEDEIQEFGYDLTNFPFHRAAELVNVLALQIPREDKRLAFQRVMVEKIKKT
jgi:hypothetical protein